MLSADIVVSRLSPLFIGAGQHSVGIREELAATDARRMHGRAIHPLSKNSSRQVVTGAARAARREEATTIRCGKMRHAAGFA
jgi:hypothetical protein